MLVACTKRALVKASHIYTPHEGLNWANQKSRKLGVFGRKLVGIHSSFIVILTNIGENEILMYLFIDMKYAVDQDYKQ